MMNNKKIVFQVTGRYMKLNRRRTLMTFIGIVLMVILMTCVFVGKNTIVSYLGKVAELDKGSWHSIVYDIKNEDAAVVEGLGVAENIGYSEAYGLTSFITSDEYKVASNLDIKAFTPEAFEMMNIKPVEGRLPENDSEIAVIKYISEEEHPLKIGDKVTAEYFTRTITGCREEMKDNPDAYTMFPTSGLKLHYGETIEVSSKFGDFTSNESFTVDKHYTGKKAEYTVVGMVESNTLTIGGGYPAFTVLPDRASMGDTVNAVYRLDLDKLNGAQDFSERVKGITGEEMYIENNELLYALSFKGTDSILRAAVLGLMIFFVLFISAASILLIYNVFSISYAERAKYLGMLSSIGATGKQKRASVFYECAVLLAAALPIGILLGFGVVKAVVTLLKPKFDVLIGSIQFGVSTDLPIILKVSPADIALIVLMCVITVILSALIPAIKISRVGPVESIRGNTEKTKKGVKTRFALLEKCLPEKLLAVNGTRRNRHLTKGIIRSIAVLGTLVTVTLYGAQSGIRLIENVSNKEDFVANYSGYEYFAASSEPAKYAELKDALSSSSQVTAFEEKRMIYTGVYLYGTMMSDTYYDNFTELAYPTWELSREEYDEWLERDKQYANMTTNFLVVSDEGYAKLAEKKNASYDPAVPSVMLVDEMNMDNNNFRFERDPEGYHAIDADHLLNARAGDDIIMFLSNSKSGDCDKTVNLTALLKAEDLRDYGKLTPHTMFGVMNEAAFEMFEEDFDDGDGKYSLSDDILLFTLAEDSDDISGQLASIDRSSDSVMINSTEIIQNMTTVKKAITAIIRIVAYCFTGMIALVCLLNLYNSVRSRALERSKETAILRSMGMTDKQFGKMYRIETRLLLTKGMTIAAAFSSVVIAAISYAIKSRVGNIKLPVPWVMLILIAAGIAAAAFLITKVCTRSAKSESIVDEIRRGTV